MDEQGFLDMSLSPIGDGVLFPRFGRKGFPFCGQPSGRNRIYGSSEDQYGKNQKECRQGQRKSIHVFSFLQGESKTRSRSFKLLPVGPVSIDIK
jgi:hypothetical protein